MPSRRQFLATAGAAAAAVGLAGCSGDADDSPSGQWLYDPGAVYGRSFPWQSYLSVAMPTAWQRREQLPDEWVATATSFDEGVESVNVDDLDRLTTLAFGTEELTTVGATAAATGDIRPRPVVQEFVDGNVTEYESVADYRLFGYAPSFLQRVQRDGVTAQGTFGLAVGQGTAVAGGLLAPTGTAVDAVAEMVRAGSAAAGGAAAAPNGDLQVVGRALRGSPLGSPPVSGGIAFEGEFASRLAGVVPESWPTLVAILDDLRAFGVGLRFAEAATLTSFVFVFHPRSIAENENLRTAVQKLLDESEDPDSGIVGVRLGPGARSLVVQTTVSAEAVWTDFRDNLPGF
ncbi:MAG: twin-arginine translocation signal domain-containing protein [Haloglomus sp.]